MLDSNVIICTRGGRWLKLCCARVCEAVCAHVCFVLFLFFFPLKNGSNLIAMATLAGKMLCATGTAAKNQKWVLTKAD